MFLDEDAARALFPEWERIADDTASILHTEASRHPDDPHLIAWSAGCPTRTPPSTPAATRSRPACQIGVSSVSAELATVFPCTAPTTASNNSIWTGIAPVEVGRVYGGILA
ncbi:MmyB family transcriptional regulator [Nocardia gipuzkoensis]